MPANIDMSLVQEALQRRQLEGTPAGGAGSPAIGQQTQPQGTTPGGGANTPSIPAPSVSAGMPTGQQPNLPLRQSNAALKTGQEAQSPQFPDETRQAAKVLVQKLLKVI
jgi:hypothetical protein